MAVYFDHNIQAPALGIQKDIAWHSSYPLLAVASQNDPGLGGTVNFYLDEVGSRELCLVSVRMMLKITAERNRNP